MNQIEEYQRERFRSCSIISVGYYLNTFSIFCGLQYLINSIHGNLIFSKNKRTYSYKYRNALFLVNYEVVTAYAYALLAYQK